MKPFIKLILCLLLLFGAKKFCHLQTEGFEVAKISHSLPAAEKIWSSLLPQELKTILDQKFYYLAKGAQSFVFASEDGRFVVKFFRFPSKRSLKAISWLPSFLSSFWQEKKERKQKLFDSEIASYKIAESEFSQETGLLYLHLVQSCDLKKLTIVDKLQIVHEIDLNHTAFAVQKKATLLYPKIQELMSQSNLEGAKQALSKLLELISSREKRGIFDQDSNLCKNFGFIEEGSISDRPIQIDIGRLQKEPTSGKLASSGEDVQHWLNHNYPELSKHFEHKMEELLLKIEHL
ncbi:MAG: hypothetical protein ACM3JI_02770 [Anaerolineae bacterium]